MHRWARTGRCMTFATRPLVVIAVELHAPRGYGRARMSIVPDATAKTLRRVLAATVDPGSTVATDGWAAYRNACRDRYVHEPHPVTGSGQDAHELLPAVHRVASLCKRWLLGTHPGATCACAGPGAGQSSSAHLQQLSAAAGPATGCG